MDALAERKKRTLLWAVLSIAPINFLKSKGLWLHVKLHERGQGFQLNLGILRLLLNSAPWSFLRH